MSKTLEAKLEKAGEEMAGAVMDAAVDLTVTVVKDAAAVGKEVVKEAIAEAKEAAEKVIHEAARKSMDSTKAIAEEADKAIEAVVASVVVTTPTIVIKLPSTAEVEAEDDKASEPVAPESVDEKK